MYIFKIVIIFGCRHAEIVGTGNFGRCEAPQQCFLKGGIIANADLFSRGVFHVTGTWDTAGAIT